MGELALRNNYTFEEYLAFEKEADIKYEYHNGFITAMADGTPEHGLIAMNFGRAIGNALESSSKPCAPYSGDVKVFIEASNRAFYPDISVVCGKLEKSTKDAHAITNPILILEVLSDSTAVFDMGVKFSHYRQLPSLKEYVLISQSEVRVETFYRTKVDTWEIHTYTKLNDSIILKSVDCEVSVSAIYRMVDGIKEGE